jgi:hypothetical protein
MADKLRLVVEYTPKEKKFLLGAPLIHANTTIGELRDLVRNYLLEHYSITIPAHRNIVIKHQKTGADVRDPTVPYVTHRVLLTLVAFYDTTMALR